jgi:hypothetical protein
MRRIRICIRTVILNNQGDSGHDEKKQANRCQHRNSDGDWGHQVIRHCVHDFPFFGPGQIHGFGWTMIASQKCELFPGKPFCLMPKLVVFKYLFLAF